MNMLIHILDAVEATASTSSSWIDVVLEFFKSQPVIIAAFTIFFTVSTRVAVKIYNMGRLAKGELVTKAEFEKYKEKQAIERKEAIQLINQTLWDRANTKIDAKLSNISDIRTVAMDVNAKSAVIDQKLLNLEANESKRNALEERVAQLETEIKRMKYGENTVETRRKD